MIEPKNFLIKLKSYLLIILAVFSFRSIAYDHYRVPTGSMIPTINIGDQVVVNKFAYGLKLPLSEFFGNPIYLTQFKAPKKGEIIVFKYPLNPKINYIKRVVATEGDIISVRNKQVFLNGRPLMMIAKNGNNLKKEMIKEYQRIPFKFHETKTGNIDHTVQTTNRFTHLDDFGPLTIPKDKFFVMGDNRDFSSDSRDWGLVPKENILGRGQAIWLSLSLPFSGGEFKFRPFRSGTLI
jgi:signal peptidase I